MNPLFPGAPPTVPPAQPQKASGRRMPLLIGVGCLGVLVMGCLFIAGIFAVSFAALRSSDAYELALAAAQHDPSVTAALGTPVRAGWFTTGQINVSGANGDANLDIPLSGPRGSGTLAVSAHKSAGKWTFSTLNVRISGAPAPLDLLPAAAP